MIKLLHLGDFHLDTPMKQLPYSRSREFNERIRQTFADAVAFARKNECSVVMMTGDLFDSQNYLRRDTFDFLISVFEANPKIRFVISAGNHDPYTPHSPYAVKSFPDNVFIFNSPEISFFEFPELELKIYGYSFVSTFYNDRPLAGFSCNSEGFAVLSAHADTDNVFSNYASVSSSELAASGFDYAGFGHIHTKPEIMHAGNTTYAHSQTLVGRDFGEQGERGGILVTLDRISGKKSVTATRVRFCPWEFAELSADITNIPENELLKYLPDEIRKYTSQAPETEFILRLRLKGLAAFQPMCEDLRTQLVSLGVSEIINESVFLLPSELERDYTVKGEFYRIIKPMLEDPDPEVREKSALALKLGLAALEGNPL